MDVEQGSVQTQSIELLSDNNDDTSDSYKLSTNEEKIVSETSHPEKESILQNLPNGNENTDNGTTTTQNNKTLIEILSTFAEKFINFVSSDKEPGQRQSVSSRLNALSAVIISVCVIILCIYVVRSQATGLSMSPSTGLSEEKYYRSIYGAIPLPTNTEPKGSTYTWNSIQSILESNKDKYRLHIQVEKSNHPKQISQSFFDFETYNKTLKISGRPNFCVKSDDNFPPESVTASETTHLHLSDMGDCYEYTKLILTNWNFPKVHHIKLHKMFIREEEFYALSNFIDKHNNTLHRVEIDECVLCQSSICDAGLLNFPNHDFQVSITRRLESPDSI